MFFDNYEIHIQAFVDFIDGKLVISDPHLLAIVRRSPGPDFDKTFEAPEII